MGPVLTEITGILGEKREFKPKRSKRILINENSNVCVQRNGIGLLSATFNRVTRPNLRFHPYQLIMKHTVNETNFQWRGAVLSVVSGRVADLFYLIFI